MTEERTSLRRLRMRMLRYVRSAQMHRLGVTHDNAVESTTICFLSLVSLQQCDQSILVVGYYIYLLIKQDKMHFYFCVDHNVYELMSRLK